MKNYQHDILIRYIAAIIILCPILGCSKNIIPQKPIQPNKYRSLVIVAAATAAVSKDSDPDNPPQPDNPSNPVRRHTECPSCNYKGWLGDGQPRADCPDCDFNNDGDNDDPMSVFGDIIKSLNEQKAAKAIAEQKAAEQKAAEKRIAEQKAAEKKIAEQKEAEQKALEQKKLEESKYEFTEEELGLKSYDSAPASNLQWSTNTKDAIDRSSGNKPILVLLSREEPGSIWLDEKVIEFINGNYVPLHASTISANVENAWASYAKKSNVVIKDKDIYIFNDNVFCILDSAGQFTSNAVNTYIPVPNTPEELIEALKNYNKGN